MERLVSDWWEIYEWLMRDLWSDFWEIIGNDWDIHMYKYMLLIMKNYERVCIIPKYFCSVICSFAGVILHLASEFGVCCCVTELMYAWNQLWSHRSSEAFLQNINCRSAVLFMPATTIYFSMLLWFPKNPSSYCRAISTILQTLWRLVGCVKLCADLCLLKLCACLSIFLF